MPPKKQTRKSSTSSSPTKKGGVKQTQWSGIKRFFTGLYKKYQDGRAIIEKSMIYVPTLLSDLKKGYEPRHRVYARDETGNFIEKANGGFKTKIQPLYVEVTTYKTDKDTKKVTEHVSIGKFNFPTYDVSDSSKYVSKNNYPRPTRGTKRMVLTGKLDSFFPVVSDNYKSYAGLIKDLKELKRAVENGDVKLDARKMAYLKAIIDAKLDEKFRAAYGDGVIDYKEEAKKKPAKEIPEPRARSSGKPKNSGRRTSPGRMRTPAKKNRKSA